MMDYSVAAIPTLYRGRRYRSRIEAKWAAFFDLVEWQHEYEPLDFGTWSPDFAVWAKGDMAVPLLVEVKPIVRFDRDTADRISGAARSAKFGGHLLLLPLCPILVSDFGTPFVQAGWQFGPDGLWHIAPLVEVGGRIAISDAIIPAGFATHADGLLAQWEMAANWVQWHPLSAGNSEARA